MKNKNAATALDAYSALVASKAPMAERLAAWDKYIAIANARPKNGVETCYRRNGRAFSVRWHANGNCSDIS